MLRHIHKAVTVADTLEGLTDFITGGAGYTRKLVGAYYETVASVDLRIYIGNDRIAEMSGDIINDATQPISIDRDIADGETVKAGWQNGSGGSITQDITLIVEEETIGG